ncbi:DUF421 domain-containing protein [Bacillus sp. CRN 9]|nr:DUF421 domain-containing protein [Bacillus sp. CRN 9]
MEGILIPVLRTCISFIILILVTLVIGKQINSHKNHYSFALSITIGSFIANMGFDTNLKFKEILISFFALVILFYFFMLLSSRSRRFRKWLSGRPTILIEKGKILDKNMKKVKFSIDDLNQHLREKEIFNISIVDYACLEVSGELSILRKKPFQNTTNRDFNLGHTSETMPIELIMDGKIIEKNLTSEYSHQWLENECHKRNLQIQDLYYAVINSNGVLFIDKYNDQLKSPTDIE